MSILKKITENKIREIAEKKKRVPLNMLKNSRLYCDKRISLKDRILDPSGKGIIAEFKRASPSKGIINDTADPVQIIRGYFKNGASGVSVLTDRKFFGGDLSDLELARKSCRVPVLRKDFILDEYQIEETRASGADAILLIAAILEKRRIQELTLYAKETGLQVLFEVHSPEELDLLVDEIDLVGVNNRNLKDFHIDTCTCMKLAGMIPPGFTKIAESGIESSGTLKKLRDAGYQGFLIGELFMSKSNPVKAMAEFIRSI